MKLMSHGYDLSLKKLIDRINAQPPSCGLDKAVDLVNQLVQFELGRFLVENGGLNGYWTSYIALHPKKGRVTGLNSEGKPFSDLESWLLNKSTFLATQERFQIFQELTQQILRSDIQLASIPCGLMDDLLLLNYSDLNRVSATGVDLDNDSLQAASENFEKLTPPISVNFEQRDAWSLSEPDRWDFITSNGLNIYIPDDAQVVELYRRFNHSLKLQGQLLVSFLTPPPLLDPKSPWENYDVENIKKAALLFSEILQIKWQCFRTEAQTIAQLEQAGFEIQTIRYDRQKMYPTVLAKKKQ